MLLPFLVSSPVSFLVFHLAFLLSFRFAVTTAAVYSDGELMISVELYIAMVD